MLFGSEPQAAWLGYGVPPLGKMGELTVPMAVER